jgi:poly-gamma-glutamate capsule biosynthesis protein CapA/YwtB (metallophosphatase superfamily)
MASTRRAALATAASVLPLAGCATRSDPVGSAGTGGDARIGLVGDVMLGRGVDERHDDHPPAAVWGSALPRLQRLDGLVGNLECCLSARGERWPAKRYRFRAEPDWALPALDIAGVSALSLANNHTLDFGPTALRDSLDGLSRTGIATTGAGRDHAAAVAPAVVEVGDVTVAVFGLTDRMPAFGAGADSPGTATASFTPRARDTRRLVRTLLDRPAVASADLVVASLHWGPNWELVKRRPLRRFARWLVDTGVDVVHGHSAHVPQGIEVYEGRPLLYDCGDLVDDYVVKPGLHNDRSFVFELVVEDGAVAAVRLHPVEIRRSTVHLADGAAAGWLRDRVRSLSERFGTAFETERSTGTLRVPVGR